MNQKKQLEKDIQALEAKLNEMRATVAAMPPEGPARWVPEIGEQYWFLSPLDCTPKPDTVYGWTGNRLSIGNVHRTQEDAETYRLRLESFVPALGPETPGDEVLQAGWAVDFNGDVDPVGHHWKETTYSAYQDGTWHPTREAAEAWLAKYGKVRGYTK